MWWPLGRHSGLAAPSSAHKFEVGTSPVPAQLRPAGTGLGAWPAAHSPWQTRSDFPNALMASAPTPPRAHSTVVSGTASLSHTC